jgi:hypothetical protein
MKLPSLSMTNGDLELLYPRSFANAGIARRLALAESAKLAAKMLAGLNSSLMIFLEVMSLSSLLDKEVSNLLGWSEPFDACREQK